jgi:hypothetical protein
VHTLNLMNVSPGSNMQSKPYRVFGDNDICNFGKHKDKSWYDIANSRNFGYFQWVLDTIAIDPTCIDHINCAMEYRRCFLNDSNLQWGKRESALENGNMERKYVCKIDEKEIESPSIEMRYCMSCNYLKSLNHYSIDKDKKLCDRCCQIQSNAPSIVTAPPPLEPSLNYNQYENKPSQQYQQPNNYAQNPNQSRFNSRTSNYPYRKTNWNPNYYQ